MSNLSLQQIGQRIYLVGDTYPHRSAIKGLGGHWDGDRRQWWVGVAKRAEIEQAIASAPAPSAAPASAPMDAPRQDKTPDRGAPVKARATYKGKDYYVLAETRDGAKRLLAARNGQFQFWAAANLTHITKEYGRESYRSGRLEYPTLGGMIDRAEQWQRMSQDERAEAREDAEARRNGERCPCSGGACRCGSDAPCCMCW